MAASRKMSYTSAAMRRMGRAIGSAMGSAWGPESFVVSVELLWSFKGAVLSGFWDVADKSGSMWLV